MLNSPESIGPRFKFQTDFAARLDKLFLHVTWHQARFLGLDIGALEAGEVHVRAGQRDASRLLVLGKARWINLFDFVQIFFKAPGVVSSFAQYLRQIDIVEREHFTDDIENAVSENRTHLFKLLQKPGQDFSLNDVLAVLGLRRDEIKGVTVALLPDAVNATKPLFQSRRVPRKIVVNHQPAELKVYAFARRFGGNANLAR